jgi:hypothetical protein
MRDNFFKKPILVIGVLILSIAAQVNAATDNKANKGSGTREDPYIVPRASSEIRVDAALDESAWEQALTLELNYEVWPLENAAAPVRTVLLLTYDENNIYAAFRCYDPDPSSVRYQLRDHDSLGGDDWAGVMLDTFNDERRNMQFLVTACGVQCDGIGSGGGEDYSWDGIWVSAGRVTDYGYALEMAIPFRTLRFQRTGGEQVWGLDAVRRYSRSQVHHIGLFPRDRNNNCYMCQFIKIKGFEGATPGRDLEINPTITAVRTDERSGFYTGDFRKRDQTAEVGVTTKWGVTPNITLSGTVNPDFSQVEADALQLDINEPFALYYQEKRPFFTEGSEYFNTSLDVVYTRMMRDPVWGVKLTGKEAGNGFGAYIVRDEITNLIFPGNQYSMATTLDLESTASVFRYKRDIGSKHTVGAIFTDREAEGYFNRVFDFDAHIYLSKLDDVRIQVLGSNTQYPDNVAEEFDQEQGDFWGPAVRLVYDHSTRSWSAQCGYDYIGRNLRTDLGFIPRVNYRNPWAVLSYTWVAKEAGWWRNFTMVGVYDYYETPEGNLLEERIQYHFGYSGALQSNTYFRAHKNRENYNGVEFDYLCYVFSASFRPTQALYAEVSSNFGDRVDYENTRPGSRLRLNPYASYNINRNMRMAFSYIFERMNSGERPLYTANSCDMTLIYHLNTRTFFRAILQYIDYDYNVSNYIVPRDPEFKKLFTQLLFSYKINPRTVLFIGYSDDYHGNFQYGLRQTDRTFFVKLGYAWVL